MYQITTDGPPVQWKFCKPITKEREENEVHKQVKIGSYGLNVLHVACKTGALSTDQNFEKILDLYIKVNFIYYMMLSLAQMCYWIQRWPNVFFVPQGTY